MRNIINEKLFYDKTVSTKINDLFVQKTLKLNNRFISINKLQELLEFKYSQYQIIHLFNIHKNYERLPSFRRLLLVQEFIPMNIVTMDKYKKLVSSYFSSSEFKETLNKNN